jgi:hypothetical protein
MISTTTWRYESLTRTQSLRGNNSNPKRSPLALPLRDFTQPCPDLIITLFPLNYKKLPPLSHSLLFLPCFVHFISRDGQVSIGNSLGSLLHKMFVSYNQLRLFRLSWYLLALLSCWSAAQQIFPAGEIAEVDLIFPRNDTYAPTVLIPIVFAIQNTKLAAPLDLALEWSVQPWPQTSNTSSPLGWGNGFINTRSKNFTSGDPDFEYDFAVFSPARESIWKLSWTVYSGICGGWGDTRIAYNNSIIFTSKNGAQLPDFVAAAANGSCDSMESVAFNVTEILPSASSNPRGECALFASSSPTPTPSPCGAKVNSAIASSISAGITSKACEGLVPSFAAQFGCTPFAEPTTTYIPKKSNVVRQDYALAGRLAWIMATLSSLSYIPLL